MVMVRYWGGRVLTLGGALLAIVAFFCPWFDVYKLNDPSYVFPRRGYSPWIVLQSGQRDATWVAVWVFALLVVAMALTCLALAMVRTPQGQSTTRSLALVLAVVGLAMVVLALGGVPFDLSFNWPYLDSNVVYGAYLALAGMLCVMVGVGLDSPVRPVA